MKAKQLYSTRDKAWGILMIFALLWLTISLPFVMEAKEKLSQQTLLSIPLHDMPVENCEDTANPLSNSVEEKAPGNASILEEYIHHTHEMLHADNPGLSHIDKHSSDLYCAFHGELLSPPPESLLS
jgi:hypothetical protein